MLNKHIIIGLLCFSGGWIAAKSSMPEASQSLYITKVQSAVTSPQEYQTSAASIPTTVQTAHALNPQINSQPAEQLMEEDELSDSQAIKVEQLLTQLELHMTPQQIEQAIADNSIYSNIEESLMNLNATQEHRLGLIAQYLDEFKLNVSTYFGASLLEDSQYLAKSHQVRVLQIMQGYTNNTYEAGELKPLSPVVENIQLYSQSPHAEIRLNALMVLSAAIDDTALLKQKIHVFLTDESEMVRQQAKTIAASLHF